MSLSSLFYLLSLLNDVCACTYMYVCVYRYLYLLVFKDCKKNQAVLPVSGKLLCKYESLIATKFYSTRVQLAYAKIYSTLSYNTVSSGLKLLFKILIMIFLFFCQIKEALNSFCVSTPWF